MSSGCHLHGRKLMRFRRIQTYQGQSVSKDGLDPAHHAFVHIKDDPGKRRGMQDSIGVAADPGGELNPLSCINYSELYTVQFNSVVRPLGNIDPRFEATFDQSSWQVLGDFCFPSAVEQHTNARSLNSQLQTRLQRAQDQNEELRARLLKLRDQLTTAQSTDDDDGDDGDEDNSDEEE